MRDSLWPASPSLLGPKSHSGDIGPPSLILSGGLWPHREDLCVIWDTGCKSGARSGRVPGLCLQEVEELFLEVGSL